MKKIDKAISVTLFVFTLLFGIVSGQVHGQEHISDDDFIYNGTAGFTREAYLEYMANMKEGLIKDAIHTMSLPSNTLLVPIQSALDLQIWLIDSLAKAGVRHGYISDREAQDYKNEASRRLRAIYGL